MGLIAESLVVENRNVSIRSGTPGRLRYGLESLAVDRCILALCHVTAPVIDTTLASYVRRATHITVQLNYL